MKPKCCLSPMASQPPSLSVALFSLTLKSPSRHGILPPHCTSTFTCDHPSCHHPSQTSPFVFFVLFLLPSFVSLLISPRRLHSGCFHCSVRWRRRTRMSKSVIVSSRARRLMQMLQRCCSLWAKQAQRARVSAACSPQIFAFISHASLLRSPSRRDPPKRVAAFRAMRTWLC